MIPIALLYLGAACSVANSKPQSSPQPTHQAPPSGTSTKSEQTPSRIIFDDFEINTAPDEETSKLLTANVTLEDSIIATQARTYIGIPFQMGGNGVTGINCLGVTRRAYTVSQPDIPRTSYPVHPFLYETDTVYGTPVAGLSPITREDLESNMHLLKAGDFVAFLIQDYHTNYPDQRLYVATINQGDTEIEFGGWHTGIYTENGNVVHAKPGSVVVEENIFNVHSDAIYVKRQEE